MLLVSLALHLCIRLPKNIVSEINMQFCQISSPEVALVNYILKCVLSALLDQSCAALFPNK